MEAPYPGCRNENACRASGCLGPCDGPPDASLERVAELSENIGRRLAKRSWNAQEKAQHAADLEERDAILTAVRPSYAGCIALRLEEPS